MNKNKLLIKFVVYDMIAALIAWILFMLFRRIVNDAQIFENVRIFIPNYDYFSSLIIFPFSCAFIHYLSGFYLYPEKQATTISFTNHACFIGYYFDNNIFCFNARRYSCIVYLLLLFVNGPFWSTFHYNTDF